MSDADLAAVDGFEVSYAGRGTLHWPGRTDVRAVLEKLGDVIQFHERSVSVYERGDKPKAGEGLNKQVGHLPDLARSRQSSPLLRDLPSMAFADLI